jgi:membrane-associated protease RseP (regulator of RpoE activity)
MSRIESRPASLHADDETPAEQRSRFGAIANEMAAGGSVDQHDPDEGPDRVTTIVGIGSWIALFGVLAWINVWMLVFVVGVLISVFLHEVGHYVTARRTGMTVTMFFMGFGPRIWSFHRNGIEYGIRAIPLGAFVRIVGMNNLDDVPAEMEPRTYRAQSYPKRMLVITAGSIMHMIIAIVLISVVYAVAGREEETGEVFISAEVDPSTPAWAAGLQEGDRILAIDGVAVTTADEVRATLRAKEPRDPVRVDLERDGEPLTVETFMGQRPDTSESMGYLGIATNSIDRVGKSIPEAVVLGGRDLVVGVGQAVVGVVKVMNPINVFEHLTNTSDDLESRPTTIVGATRISDDVALFAGWAGVIQLLAGLNVSVGVFNMFPLLPLDGGHAAIATYERIRSRRGQRYVADVAKLMPVLAVTIGLLAFMFLTGLYLDIARPL